MKGGFLIRNSSFFRETPSFFILSVLSVLSRSSQSPSRHAARLHKASVPVSSACSLVLPGTPGALKMHQPSSSPQFLGGNMGNWDHHLRMNSRKSLKNFAQVGLLSSHFRRCQKSDGLAGWKRTRGCLEPPWRLKPSRLEEEA